MDCAAGRNLVNERRIIIAAFRNCKTLPSEIAVVFFGIRTLSNGIAGALPATPF
jgi:hypothetical protein